MFGSTRILVITTILSAAYACAQTDEGEHHADDKDRNESIRADGDESAILKFEGAYAAGRPLRPPPPFPILVGDSVARLSDAVQAAYFAELTSSDVAAPDGVGRFSLFSGPLGRGAVYRHPERSLGAHAVYGSILEEWERQGWEVGFGYPTDEPGQWDSLEYQNFEHARCIVSDGTDTAAWDDGWI